jgi:hypothetical protein
MPAEFNPNKTHISASSLATWLASPVTDDIKQVPGIADGNAEKLAENGVHTTYQLMGVFLSLKGALNRLFELFKRGFSALTASHHSFLFFYRSRSWLC